MRLSLVCALVAMTACKPQTPAANSADASASTSPGGALQNDQEKTLYALGLVMGQRMGDFNLTPAELTIVQRGIRDSVTGATPQVELRQFGPKINEMAQERSLARANQEKERGRAYADRMAQEAGAQRLPSGLIFRELRAGTGPQPGATDMVRVHYRGTLINGREFDSSYGADGMGQAVEFQLNRVIPCWTEGVQRLHVGGKAKLVCPSDIAYGDRGQREIPPGATLTFEVELVATSPAPPEPALPPELQGLQGMLNGAQMRAAGGDAGAAPRGGDAGAPRSTAP
jgi:FKBP-type peptidyl-prolyl cis-trans isomerase FkpA